jgi:UDP-N-acetyl-D-mannosaminuronate dehydrogenase
MAVKNEDLDEFSKKLKNVELRINNEMTVLEKQNTINIMTIMKVALIFPFLFLIFQLSLSQS